MKAIRQETLQKLRETYTIGSRVELIQMDDPYSHLSVGAKGTVVNVDDIGTIHVNWDDGGSLGVVFGADTCKLIAN